MAYLSASRSFQGTLHAHFRSLVISSWVKNRRKSSSSFRCIPMESAKIKRTVKFSPINSAEETRDPSGSAISEMTKFGRKFFRSSHFDSKDMSSSDIFYRNEFLESEDVSNYSSEIMEVDMENNFELSLKEAQDADVTKKDETEEVKNCTIMQDAEKMAVELLAIRAFTALELRKKLRGKKYPLDIVDTVVASMKDRDHIFKLLCFSSHGVVVQRGLLNDGLYAESFSRSRWLSSTWGPRRIKQSLRQKGVNENIVDTATKRVFEEDDFGDSSESTQHGMSKSALERLYLQASKQWLRGQNPSFENQKARIIRWLQYRGFSWRITSIILKRLVAEYPP